MAQDRRQSDTRDQSVDLDEEWRDQEMDEKKRIQMNYRTTKTLREMKQDILITDVEYMDTKPVVANAEEIALKALHVDDDPTLNPWTFRVFILGVLASGPSSLYPMMLSPLTLR